MIQVLWNFFTPVYLRPSHRISTLLHPLSMPTGCGCDPIFAKIPVNRRMNFALQRKNLQEQPGAKNSHHFCPLSTLLNTSAQQTDWYESDPESSTIVSYCFIFFCATTPKNTTTHSGSSAPTTPRAKEKIVDINGYPCMKLHHPSSTTLPATHQPSGTDPPKGLRMFGRADPLHHRGPWNFSSLQAETKAARISTMVLVCPGTLQDLLECLPVHRHSSYVYCMPVWNMSWNMSMCSYCNHIQ